MPTSSEKRWAKAVRESADSLAREFRVQGVAASRWIARTPDQDALGLCLPSTAEHEGYSAEKAKGKVGQLAAGESVEIRLRAGLLEPAEAQERIGAINAILQ